MADLSTDSSVHPLQSTLSNKPSIGGESAAYIHNEKQSAKSLDYVATSPHSAEFTAISESMPISDDTILTNGHAINNNEFAEQSFVNKTVNYIVTSEHPIPVNDVKLSLESTIEKEKSSEIYTSKASSSEITNSNKGISSYYTTSGKFTNPDSSKRRSIQTIHAANSPDGTTFSSVNDSSVTFINNLMKTQVEDMTTHKEHDSTESTEHVTSPKTLQYLMSENFPTSNYLDIKSRRNIDQTKPTKSLFKDGMTQNTFSTEGGIGTRPIKVNAVEEIKTSMTENTTPTDMFNKSDVPLVFTYHEHDKKLDSVTVLMYPTNFKESNNSSGKQSDINKLITSTEIVGKSFLEKVTKSNKTASEEMPPEDRQYDMPQTPSVHTITFPRASAVTTNGLQSSLDSINSIASKHSTDETIRRSVLENGSTQYRNVAHTYSLGRTHSTKTMKISSESTDQNIPNGKFIGNHTNFDNITAIPIKGEANTDQNIPNRTYIGYQTNSDITTKPIKGEVNTTTDVLYTENDRHIYTDLFEMDMSESQFVSSTIANTAPNNTVLDTETRPRGGSTVLDRADSDIVTDESTYVITNASVYTTNISHSSPAMKITHPYVSKTNQGTSLPNSPIKWNHPNGRVNGRIKEIEDEWITTTPHYNVKMMTGSSEIMTQSEPHSYVTILNISSDENTDEGGTVNNKVVSESTHVITEKRISSSRKNTVVNSTSPEIVTVSATTIKAMHSNNNVVNEPVRRTEDERIKRRSQNGRHTTATFKGSL